MLDPGHEAEPREGRNPEKPPFEFHRLSVERAVYGHVFSEFEDLPWTELPLRVGVDLWREEVKRWSLNDLLPRSDGQSPVDQIGTEIFAKLQASTDDIKAEERIPASREATIIQSRGIRILDLSIRNLRVPEEIQAERQLQWRERWSGAVQDELADATEQVEDYRRQGNRDAHQLLLSSLTVSLAEQLEAGQSPPRRETLNLIIVDAIRMLNEEDFRPESRTLVSQLQTIIENLSNMDSSCREPER